MASEPVSGETRCAHAFKDSGYEIVDGAKICEVCGEAPAHKNHCGSAEPSPTQREPEQCEGECGNRWCSAQREEASRDTLPERGTPEHLHKVCTEAYQAISGPSLPTEPPTREHVPEDLRGWYEIYPTAAYRYLIERIGRAEAALEIAMQSNELSKYIKGKVRTTLVAALPTETPCKVVDDGDYCLTHNRPANLCALPTEARVPEDGWINTEDGLPSDGVEVLFSVPGCRGVEKGRRYDKKWESDRTDPYGNTLDWTDDEVDCWMILPEPKAARASIQDGRGSK